MPKLRPISDSRLRALRAPEPSHLVLGTNEDDRRNKSFLPDARAVGAISNLGAFVERHRERLRRLHRLETGEDLDDRALEQRYNSIRTYRMHHEHLLRTFGSHKGFSALTGTEHRRRDQEHDNESAVSRDASNGQGDPIADK